MGWTFSEKGEYGNNQENLQGIEREKGRYSTEWTRSRGC